MITEDGDFDRYEGWIQAKQLCEISEEALQRHEGQNVHTLLIRPVAEYNGSC